MRTRRAAAVALVALWAAVCGISTGVAAQPPWDVLAKSLYVILYENRSWNPSDTNHGIWRYDPTTKVFTRLRPFESYRGRPPSECESGPGFLTALQDRVVFQDQMAYVEVEAPTLREVRRYPPLRDPLLLGATVVGPALAVGVAAAAGIEPGIYGRMVCGGYCSPLPCAVDYHGPPILGHLVRRDVDPAGGVLQVLADLSSLSPTSLSFDAVRGGFWLTRRGSPYLLPIRNGAIDVAGGVEQPVSFRLDAMVRHPTSGRLFGLRVPDDGRLFPAQFLALNENLEIIDTLGTWGPYVDQPKDRVPWTFTALQPAPPTDYEQTIPIVAHAGGKNGSFWTSELWLFNPSAQPTTIRIRRVTAPDAPERTVDLPAHGSLHVTDALSWMGGGPDGDGVSHDALVLTSPYRLGEQVVAAGRNSTLSSDPDEQAKGGTVGHGVPAVPGLVGYSNHLGAAKLPAVSYAGQPAVLLLDDLPGRFRHDLGVVNMGDDPLVITLWWGMETTPYALSGNAWPPAENARSVTTPPHSVGVFGIEELFPALIRESWPAKLGVTGERPAPIWLSMVDNLTNDATFVPFTVFSMQGDAETPVAIPVVADVSGEHGSWWRTDLYADMFAFSGGPAMFHASSRSVGPAPPSSVGPAHASASATSTLWIARDVVRILYPAGGVRGAVEYHVGSWMCGYARNYTSRPDGGTYGDMLPFYPPHGWPVQHFAGIEVSPQFRINLGLFNGDKDHAITHRLLLYTADGTLVVQRELTLAPWENLNERLERVLGLELGSLPDGTYGLTVLPLDDPAHGVEGRSWAFVSLVDNVTNDPTHWW